MADQDQTIEKKLEGSDLGGDEKMASDIELNKTEGDLEKKGGLDDIASPDSDQEKKKEVMEAIQQKGGSVNDDDLSDEDDHQKIKNHAKDISETKDIEQQIDKLVKLAVQKDPYTAMKVARHLDENYVLDQVHDKLVEDETKKALIEKGLLKEF